MSQLERVKIKSVLTKNVYKIKYAICDINILSISINPNKVDRYT